MTNFAWTDIKEKVRTKIRSIKRRASTEILGVEEVKIEVLSNL